MAEAKPDHLNGTSEHPVVVTSTKLGLIVCFGTLSADKSNSASLLTEQIGYTGIPLIVFDQEGDFLCLLPSSGKAVDKATKQLSMEVQA